MLAEPTVSLVIPAYNEERTIRACVVAAIEQSEPADEIIVVDNRSTDRTADVVRQVQREYPEAPVVLMSQDDEQGLVPTRNLGLDRALGDVLGRIDADTVLEPDWVAQVRRIFRDETVDAATGPMIYYDMPWRRWGHRADDAVRRAMHRLARDFHYIFGSNMALRASAWRGIRSHVCRDLRDEMHEDIDISLHLYELGFRAVYDSALVAGMSARRLDDNPRDYYSYVRRWERTYEAHGVRDMALRAPMWVFAGVYPLLKGVRWNAKRKAERQRQTREDVLLAR